MSPVSPCFFSFPLSVWPLISLLNLGRKEESTLTHYSPHFPTKSLSKRNNHVNQGIECGMSWKGVETRDAIKHPTVQRTTPMTKKYLTPNVSSADIEKPSLEYVKFKVVG